MKSRTYLVFAIFILFLIPSVIAKPSVYLFSQNVTIITQNVTLEDTKWIDIGEWLQINTSTANNVNITGNINATSINASLDCSLLSGGSDGDFCADADSIGTAHTSQLPIANITNLIGSVNCTGTNKVNNITINDTGLFANCGVDETTASAHTTSLPAGNITSLDDSHLHNASNVTSGQFTGLFWFMDSINTTTLNATTVNASIDCSLISAATSDICIITDTDTQRPIDNATIINPTGALEVNGTWINQTVLNLTASTTYLPHKIVTQLGTLDGGRVEDVVGYEDGMEYNVSEVGGVNPLQVEINFTNVTNFNILRIRAHYSGGQGHEIAIELFHIPNNNWELLGEITDMADFAPLDIFVADPANHLNGTNVTIRFRHVQNGLASHDFFIDYIVLIDGFTSQSNADHDSLLGRDDKVNHPWAMPTDASRDFSDTLNITGNLTLNERITFLLGEIIDNIVDGWIRITGALLVTDNLNVTGNITANVINVSDWGNVSITETQISDLAHTTDTNESARFNNLTVTDCEAGNLVIGIETNGTVKCAADADTADTNESARFNNLTATDCVAGTLVIGVLVNGSVNCATDADTADTNESSRVNYLVDTDCEAGTLVIGIDNNGTVSCVADANSGAVTTLPMENITNRDYGLILNITNITDWWYLDNSILLDYANISNHPVFTTSLPMANITLSTWTYFFNISADIINATSLNASLDCSLISSATSNLCTLTDTGTTTLPAVNITGLDNSHTHNITNTTDWWYLDNSILSDYANITNHPVFTISLPIGNITSLIGSVECGGTDKIKNVTINDTGLFATCDTDVSVTDTNESIRFNNLTLTDCDAGTLVIGIETNGSVNCAADADTADTNESIRFNNLTGTDCQAGTLVIGIANNGTVLCASDAGGEVHTLSLPMSNITGRDNGLTLNASNITAGQFLGTYSFMNDINGTSINATLDCTNIGGATSDLCILVDTNESIRFNNLTLTDCEAGTLVIGIEANGTVKCATDADADTIITTLPMANITGRDNGLTLNASNVTSGTFGGSYTFGDNNKVCYGDSDDVCMYFDGDNFLIG